MSYSPKEIGNKIKEARESAGLTLEELAGVLGLHKSTVQRYEAGKIEKIKLPIIESMAEALSVNPLWLMGSSEVRQAEQSQSFDNIFPMNKKRYRILGSIACGEPIWATEEEEYILSPTHIDADFCLRCKGDSMVGARIYDGDIVFIKEQPSVDNGEIAAVIIENEATLKRVNYFPEKNMLILKAENPKYSDLIYIGEELDRIRILGKAVAFQSRVR